ncbi:MAG: helix-turn-helix domain-containing protein [Bacilli bacterium]|nr:helix-turn-helix domain-containing protein [Bacilli bacterium]
MEELKFTISKNLIKLRKHNKLTQAELANHVNYSDKSVSKWETGETTPSVEILKTLADFYNVTVDDILSENFQPEKHFTTKERRYSRLIISLLGISTIWIVAVVCFVFTTFIYKTSTHPWMLFIYATPATFLLAVIFNSIWGKKAFTYVLISILLWTILTSLFLTFLMYSKMNIWGIYLIGLPIQVSILLFSKIKKKR